MSAIVVGMRRPKLSMADVRAVLAESTPTSPLGRWMAENRSEFAASLSQVRPNWEALVVKFAEAELIRVNPVFWGKADTPARRKERKRAAEAAKQVWQRVKRKDAGTRQTVAPARAPTAAAPSPRPGTPPSRRSFTPATWKKPE